MLSTCVQVVKEILRFRPPAPMVPQVAMKPFKLTESYTAPKGAFIIPDIVSACRQGYTDPLKFDPDRFRWAAAGGRGESVGGCSSGGCLWGGLAQTLRAPEVAAAT
jgi:cytochrome P450